VSVSLYREATVFCMENRRLTQDELHDLLVGRFGDDPMRWAFRCPRCGDVATGRDISEALAADPRTGKDGEAVTTSDVLGQECVGRLIGALRVKAGEYGGRGCDWCSFGLFPGPWFVATPDGQQIPCFPVADGGV
jgi:hypothetical protein